MRPHRLRAMRHMHRPDDDHDGQQQTSTTRRPDEAAALHNLHHLHQITTQADRAACAPSAPPHTAADRAACCLRLAPPAPPR